MDALLADDFQLPATFPDAGQRLPQLLIRDVQVPLRRLDVGMSEHQLDDPNVAAVREQPAGAFVAQIVPVQVDLPELPAMLLTYDFYDRAEASAVRAIAGDAPIGGRLPIALPGMFDVGFGLARPGPAPSSGVR